jgi:hypothetical protein
MAHAPGSMIALRPADDKRVASRARRAVLPRQLDLFGGPPRARRKPLTAEKLAALAAGVWRASRPITEGTPAARFLRLHHLPIPDASEARWHPSLRRKDDERGPGIVLLARDIETGEVCGCMRIFIDELGWVVGKPRPLGRVFYGATLNRDPRPP